MTFDADTAAPIEEHRFPCPACGSDLRYAPGTETLACDHCGNTEQIGSGGPWRASGALAELDFNEAVAGRVPASEIEVTRVLNCESCGAQIEFDPATHAKECPFCASPIVTDTGENRHIKPRAVLPFTLDESAARGAMKRWLGRLWFAPNGLKEYARKGRKMQGIYVPYWTFDAPTRTRYRGQRGTAYYETRTRRVNGKTQTTRVRKIRWTNVSGHVARDFDDVLVLASTSLPRSHTDALEPWDLPALEPYQPEYIAGFRAEAYQIELDDGWTEARHKIDRIIASDIRRDIGGDEQRITDTQTDIGRITFKHILLPVWLAAYKFRGETYRFVVNARTGEVNGERPYSAWKIAFAVVAALLLVGAIVYLDGITQ